MRTRTSYRKAALKAAKTRKRRAKNKRIAKAFSKNKGALHRMLRVPLHKKIPVAKLRAAVKKGGLVARRAQLVLNMRKARLRKSI